jgi:hypothetical protein
MKFKTLIVVIYSVVLASCSITKPVSATSNPIGSKTGKSTGTCILFICINADASITSAAKNAGISKISTVDYRTTNYLGLIQRHECIVTGE